MKVRNWIYFNPHEREARDGEIIEAKDQKGILIHTSVKLVTANPRRYGDPIKILIHTSVKLVTKEPG